MKTYTPKASDIKHDWQVMDASGQTLGRMATRIAHILMGKQKAMYSPHVDCGDYVVVINAARISVTGRKLKQKMYYRYTGYPGGLKQVPLGEMLAKHPDRVIQHAVKGMLPHNRLGHAMIKKLKVYAGESHPHEAQVKGENN
ncbi:MAG: 50S ribosomal protein L13 [Chloroflexota bacterium]